MNERAIILGYKYPEKDILPSEAFYNEVKRLDVHDMYFKCLSVEILRIINIKRWSFFGCKVEEIPTELCDMPFNEIELEIENLEELMINKSKIRTIDKSIANLQRLKKILDYLLKIII